MNDEYFDSEEFREMLAEYEDAMNMGMPVFMDADELSEIADYYQTQERYDEADAAIELALSLSPGAVAPLTFTRPCGVATLRKHANILNK